VRGERDAAGNESGGPAPGLGSGGGGAEGEERRGRRADKGVDGLPDGVDEGNFVGEKFHEVENAGDGEDERMGENLELLGEMNDAETLEEAEGGDGGVDIEAGGEAGAENEAESFEGAHGFNDE